MTTMTFLRCAFPAETPQFFSVQVEPSMFINDLRATIYHKLKSVYKVDVSFDDIKLFKVDIPTYVGESDESLLNRVRHYLHVHSSDAPLPAGRGVKQAFPESSTYEISVLVFNAEGKVLELLDALAEPQGLYKRKIRKDLTRAVKTLPSKAPSELVRDAANVEELLDSGYVYINHIPVALFNRALAKLQQRLEDSEFPVTPEEVAMDKYYVDVAERFEDYQHEVLWANGPPMIVLEQRQVPGVGEDPKLKCIANMVNAIRTQKLDVYRGSCNFPMVLIAIAGSRLQISIAVYVGAVFISDLVDMDVRYGFHGHETTIRLTRISKALSLCREELRKSYTCANILCVTSSPRDISFLYPQPLSATETPLPIVQYNEYLNRNGAPMDTVPDIQRRTTALYTGTFDGKRVLIKFTPSYHSEAHCILAGAGFAPKLYFCGLIVGNLYMVVMDYIPDAKRLNAHTGDELVKVLPLAIQKVEEAVSILHQRDIVFADLRDNNIIISGEGDGKCVMLIDFDWAGTHDVDRYPATLNPASVWANGVEAYGMLKKEHDLWQIKRLKQILAPFQNSGVSRSDGPLAINVPSAPVPSAPVCAAVDMIGAF
ncbi:hypothetical protein D9613_009478 [Agrocybe pediades]|uniref:Crinkler effector protein N-terminal domain-containing protein n=1 Tax=Agrocybe pediades TaxID=84607 RepID=A0A8H4VTY3_9AGAR|nr:hypothetical protein D9613_009478 [Agrocybe pediades]